jgi:predicted transcriptional regulator
MARGGGPSDVDNDEILAFLASGETPARGQTEIGDAVGMSDIGARGRLRDMMDDDLVDSHDAGVNVIWFLTSEGEQYVSAELDLQNYQFGSSSSDSDSDK